MVKWVLGRQHDETLLSKLIYPKLLHLLYCAEISQVTLTPKRVFYIKASSLAVSKVIFDS